MTNMLSTICAINSLLIIIGNPIVLSSADYTIYADGQIRYADENKLSDWETITLSTNSASPTIIDYDGELIVSSLNSSGGSTGVVINGHSLPLNWNNNGGGTLGACGFLISKNDSVYSTSPVHECWARYYKNRDYSNR